jgi:bile acid:Na+ symporter, BASS family
MYDLLMQVVMPVAMFCLMFAMGLTLTTSDFKRILVLPKATLMGLLVQLLIVPSIGFFLAYLFQLPLMMAVGLVAVAACPGGTTSNVVVHVGKGDTALSITLTAAATMAALVTLPLWINYNLDFFGGDGVVVEMPILDTALQLGTFTILPVIIGMFARILRPHWLRFEPRVTKVSVVTMFTTMVVMGVLNDGAIDRAGQLLLPTFILVGAAAVVGYIIPLLAGVSQKDSATIAVETCLKNILLSLFIATNTLQNVDAAIASAVAGLAIVPVAILVMILYNVSNRRRVALESNVDQEVFREL